MFRDQLTMRVRRLLCPLAICALTTGGTTAAAQTTMSDVLELELGDCQLIGEGTDEELTACPSLQTQSATLIDLVSVGARSLVLTNTPAGLRAELWAPNAEGNLVLEVAASNIRGAELAPNSGVLLTLGESTPGPLGNYSSLTLHDPGSGTATLLSAATPIHVDGAYTFSADGRWLFYLTPGSGGYDLHRAEVATPTAPQRLAEGLDVLSGLAAAEDGSAVAFVGAHDQGEAVYHVAAGGTVNVVSETIDREFWLSSDGQQVALLALDEDSHRSLRLWTAGNHRAVGLTFADTFDQIRISPDQHQLVVSWTGVRAERRVAICSLEDASCEPLDISFDVASVVFDPDSDAVAFMVDAPGFGSTLHRWSSEGRHEISRDVAPESAAFTPAGLVFCRNASDNEASVLDIAAWLAIQGAPIAENDDDYADEYNRLAQLVESGEVMISRDRWQHQIGTGICNTMQVSPDRTSVAFIRDMYSIECSDICRSGGPLQVRSLSEGFPVQLERSDVYARSLVFSEYGSSLAWADVDYGACYTGDRILRHVFNPGIDSVTDSGESWRIGYSSYVSEGGGFVLLEILEDISESEFRLAHIDASGHYRQLAVGKALEVIGISQAAVFLADEDGAVLGVPIPQVPQDRR